MCPLYTWMHHNPSVEFYEKNKDQGQIICIMKPRWWVSENNSSSTEMCGLGLRPDVDVCMQSQCLYCLADLAVAKNVWGLGISKIKGVMDFGSVKFNISDIYKFSLLVNWLWTLLKAQLLCCSHCCYCFELKRKKDSWLCICSVFFTPRRPFPVLDV